MAITLGSKSRSRLEGVHPDMVRVVLRAAEVKTTTATAIVKNISSQTLTLAGAPSPTDYRG